jgi:hypothetical protein
MCTRKDTRTSNVCEVLHFLEPLGYNLARNINNCATTGQGSLTMPYDTWNLSLTNNSALIAESSVLYFYYQCITCIKKTKFNSSTKPSGQLMEAMPTWQVIFPS